MHWQTNVEHPVKQCSHMIHLHLAKWLRATSFTVHVYTAHSIVIWTWYISHYRMESRYKKTKTNMFAWGWVQMIVEMSHIGCCGRFNIDSNSWNSYVTAHDTLFCYSLLHMICHLMCVTSGKTPIFRWQSIFGCKFSANNKKIAANISNFINVDIGFAKTV